MLPAMGRLLEELGRKKVRHGASFGRSINSTHKAEVLFMRKRLLIAALAAMALLFVAGSALAANGKSSVIFDSTNPNGPKTNLPSYGPDGVLLRDDRRQDRPRAELPAASTT